ncbi:MAG: DUF378 domain-containing protein [Candidatus Harrisonbacteria bacterium CG10_big_fil_rev_8_21_14_0_10_44_23]|uniref:DUF378 domain-containing protein n=1 Tax=Candidatus Harrisonbacteria bacterium CG10_big_fil_rev_8_21_14_0_10_44_23 TaxID=1974585 RepID=A0A2H0US40_9BACT|nr:MAG: DUF378 domain-containing protein [Candidatus Harrisonbacteria bacterium CG10_big_fil_rev_8_21_14_0_10_44_23]
MKIVHIIAFIILIVGALNVGIVGAFDYDFLWMISGYNELIIRIIYVLVGVAALLMLATHWKSCSSCCGSKMSGPTKEINL